MPSPLFSVVNITAAPHHNIVVGISMSSSCSFPLAHYHHFPLWGSGRRKCLCLISGTKCLVLNILAIVLSVFEIISVIN